MCNLADYETGVFDRINPPTFPVSPNYLFGFFRFSANYLFGFFRILPNYLFGKFYFCTFTASILISFHHVLSKINRRPLKRVGIQ